MNSHPNFDFFNLFFSKEAIGLFTMESKELELIQQFLTDLSYEDDIKLSSIHTLSSDIFETKRTFFKYLDDSNNNPSVQGWINTKQEQKTFSKMTDWLQQSEDYFFMAEWFIHTAERISKHTYHSDVQSSKMYKTLTQSPLDILRSEQPNKVLSDWITSSLSHSSMYNYEEMVSDLLHSETGNKETKRIIQRWKISSKRRVNIADKYIDYKSNYYSNYIEQGKAIGLTYPKWEGSEDSNERLQRYKEDIYYLAKENDWETCEEIEEIEGKYNRLLEKQKTYFIKNHLYSEGVPFELRIFGLFLRILYESFLYDDKVSKPLVSSWNMEIERKKFCEFCPSHTEVNQRFCEKHKTATNDRVARARKLEKLAHKLNITSNDKRNMRLEVWTILLEKVYPRFSFSSLAKAMEELDVIYIKPKAYTKRKRKTLTKNLHEYADKIIEKRKGGISVIDIAAEYDYSTQSIYSILNGKGNRENRQDAYGALDVNIARKLRAEDLTYAAIGKKFGCSRQAVHKLLTRNH